MKLWSMLIRSCHTVSCDDDAIILWSFLIDICLLGIITFVPLVLFYTYLISILNDWAKNEYNQFKYNECHDHIKIEKVGVWLSSSVGLPLNLIILLLILLSWQYCTHVMGNSDESIKVISMIYQYKSSHTINERA